jgi:hypothetical protein
MSVLDSQSGRQTSGFDFALREGLQRVKNVINSDSFTFVINGTRFEIDIIDALLLSPAAHERLQHDRRDTTIVIDDDNISCAAFSKLTDLLKCVSVEVNMAERKSMILLCRYLQNNTMEKIFFGLSIGQSSSISVTFGSSKPSDCSIIASDFYLYSKEDLSLLSVETLSDILSSDSLVLLSEDSLFDLLISFGDSYSALFDHLRIEFLSSRGISNFFDKIDFSRVTFKMWSSLGLRMKGIFDSSLKMRRFRRIDSNIIQSYADILSTFGDQIFGLLYRGSRDGFDSSTFHDRCDGKPHTVTIVETTLGFIFGGYTPTVWDRTSGSKSDSSLQSFIFTLKNAQNMDPKKFSLKSASNQCAIWSGSGYGPIFGGGHDFQISSNSNATTSNYSNFGHTYNNDTGCDGKTFLAGAYNFTVKELEVFHVHV